MTASEIRCTEGVAYGVIRGRCLAANCTCSQFHASLGGGPCQSVSCGHYSTDHAFYGYAQCACSFPHCRCDSFRDWPLHKLNNQLPAQFDPNDPLCHNCGHSKSGHTRDRNWTVNPSEIEFIKEIGAGQFSTVFLGSIWGTEVAIKKVKKKFNMLSESDVEMLFTEIDILSNLHHPNLISFVAAVLNPSNFMIITEFCARGALSDTLYSDTAVAWDVVLQYALDIATGMNFLHHHNIVHRDLKSDNILVTSNGVCKIADFGLSCFISVHSRKLRYGTPFWMAPEVINSLAYTTKSDVFSFGIVLCELFSRSFPYSERDQADEEGIMQAVVLSKLRPALPDWVPPAGKALAESCWNSDVTQRPVFDTVVADIRLLQKQQCKVVPVIPVRKKIEFHTSPEKDEFEKKPELSDLERKHQKEASQGRAAVIRMRNFFQTASLLQSNNGCFVACEDLHNAWVKAGGLKNLSKIGNISDDAHATLSTFTLLEWIWKWFSQFQQTDILETQQVGVGKYETSVVSVMADPCAGFVYALNYAESHGKPGSKYIEKAKEFVIGEVGEKIAQKLFQKYRDVISRKNKSSGMMFYS